MPTYQYACTACGHRFEAVQSFTDPALTACPECAGTLRKVYSAVGIVFKGSGFYRTDSRDGAKPAAGGAKEPGSTSSSASSDASGGSSSGGSASTSPASSSGSGSGGSAPAPAAAAASAP